MVRIELPTLPLSLMVWLASNVKLTVTADLPGSLSVYEPGVVMSAPLFLIVKLTVPSLLQIGAAPRYGSVPELAASSEFTLVVAVAVGVRVAVLAASVVEVGVLVAAAAAAPPWVVAVTVQVAVRVGVAVNTT